MRKRFKNLIIIPFLLFFALPVDAIEKEERSWQDESIYFIMVDRFNNGDTNNDFEVNPIDSKSYNGGDFKGITDKLDYIKEMGFTSIWLTPVFDNEANGYHGYWIQDFYKTEEHFGTLEEFKTLVKEAHDRDIKVILDFVVNHVGPNHPWVNEEAKKSWFHDKQPITNWNSQEEVENNWLFDLPDLNTENPETRTYLFDAAKWWIEETDVDGYRLDTVKHVPKEFWTEFASEVKSVKEDFYLLGEVWHNDLRVVAAYQDTGIDGFVDFPQNEHLRTSFSKPNTSLGWLFASLDRNQAFYDRPELLGTFMDNHDMTRFTREILQYKHDPVVRWKLAMTYLFTAPGIPIVYYGSEIALDGGEDPDNRRMMKFDGDNELISYIAKLGELRKVHPSLTRGKLELLHEENGVAIYSKQHKKETMVIAINNTIETQSIKIDLDFGESKKLVSVLNELEIKGRDQTFNLELKAEKADIYLVANHTGLKTSTKILIGVGVIGFILLSLIIWRKTKKV